MKINDKIDQMGVPENEFEAVAGVPEAPMESAMAGLNFDLSGIIGIIFAETGPADDYINHPLNFKNSPGLGQMIQGITGFLRKFTDVESLRLAILDVVFGFLKYKNELRGGQDEHV